VTVAETGVLALRRGSSVWMVSRKHPPTLGGMEVLSAKVVEEVGALVPVTAIARGVTPLGLIWFLPLSAGRLLAGLIARRVAVLHLHDPVLAPLGWLARCFKVPVVVTLHGLDVCYPNPVYRAYFRSMARSFAAYVCISRHVATLAEAAGIAPTRLHIIPVGIASDVRRRHPDTPPPRTSAPWPDDASLILTVGRLVTRKGVSWFVSEVFPSLAERFPDLHYVIAGAGPDENAVREAIGARGLEKRVHLLGAVSDSAKRALLDRASVVAMPNVPVVGDAEGFGLAALEAAQAGRPLVAADLEGLRDSVISCHTGVRVAAADAAAWIGAVTQLLKRPSLAEALGRRAKRSVATRFAWGHIARRYCDIYRAVLERTP